VTSLCLVGATRGHARAPPDERNVIHFFSISPRPPNLLRARAQDRGPTVAVAGDVSTRGEGEYTHDRYILTKQSPNTDDRLTAPNIARPWRQTWPFSINGQHTHIRHTGAKREITYRKMYIMASPLRRVYRLMYTLGPKTMLKSAMGPDRRKLCGHIYICFIYIYIYMLYSYY